MNPKQGILLASLSLCLTAHAAEDVDSSNGVYKNTPEGELRYGMFAPKGHRKTDRRPAVVIFFGGGWVSGRNLVVAPHARFFAKNGYVGFFPKYRVRNKDGEHIRPFHCVEDGKSFLRFLREHADELGIDPNRIIAGGISAGGHVAAATATIEGFEGEGENGEISSVPNGLLLLNPVLDTTSTGYKSGLKLFTDEEEAKSISPCHHVRADLPPALVVHGTADPVVPHENSERFVRLMKLEGNEGELVSLEGQRHGCCNRPGVKGVTSEVWETWTTAALTFFERQGLAPEKTVAGPE